jgi:hypothetical protein
VAGVRCDAIGKLDRIAFRHATLRHRSDSIEQDGFPMKYNYATEVAAGACPGCGQPVILYHHVRITTGKERREVRVLDTVFCRECVEHMYDSEANTTISHVAAKHISSHGAH